jgi:hypothetical protein
MPRAVLSCYLHTKPPTQYLLCQKIVLITFSLCLKQRWLTHLCMWNPVPGVAVAAAGRSPAWQLGPGVKEDEEKIQILSTGSLFSKQPCFRFIPSLRFLWKGLSLRDIKATRVALIPRRGHPPVLIPWPVQVGWLQWPSGRHHPDKGERHR